MNVRRLPFAVLDHRSPNGTRVSGTADGGRETAARADRLALGSGGSAAMAHPEWQRYGHTATALPDGRILVIGGRRHWGGAPVVEYGARLLDPVTGVWSVAAAPLTPRADHKALALADGRVLVLGRERSWARSSERTRAVTAETYDPVAGAWSPVLGVPPIEIVSRIVRGEEGAILVIGWCALATGSDAAGPGTPTVWAATADLGSWREVGSAPVEVGGGAAASLASGMCLFSGGAWSHVDTRAAEALADADADPSEFRKTRRMEVWDGAWVLDPKALTWRRVAPMSRARGEHSLTPLADGRVLAAGGVGMPAHGEARDPGDLEVLASTEIYDPRVDRWAPGPPMPSPRAGHTSVAMSRGPLLIGGKIRQEGQSAWTASSVLWYEQEAESWGEYSGPRVCRHHPTVVVVPPSRVLVIGGNDHEPLAEAIEPGTWWRPLPRFAPGALPTESPAATLAERSGHTATALADGSVLIVGGRRVRPEPPWAEPRAVRYVPAERCWMDAGQLTAGRAGHLATRLPDGRVLVVGGFASSGESAADEVWDPPTSAWSPIAKLGVTRRDVACAATPDGAVYVIGGLAAATGGAEDRWEAVGDVESADRELGRWRPGPRLAHARSGAFAFALPDGAVIVLGGKSGAAHRSPPVREIERLDRGRDHWRPAGLLEVDATGAVPLLDGRILAMGDGGASVYDPVGETVQRVAGPDPGWRPTVTRLPDGRVALVQVWFAGRGRPRATVSVFDPATLRWTETRHRVREQRGWSTATALPDDTVLLVGGEHCQLGAEILDLKTGRSRPAV